MSTLCSSWMFYAAHHVGSIHGDFSRPPKVLYPCKGPKDFPKNLPKDHKSYPNLVLRSPISYFPDTCMKSQISVYKAGVLTIALYVQ